jgi:hypothetical protein
MHSVRCSTNRSGSNKVCILFIVLLRAIANHETPSNRFTKDTSKILEQQQVHKDCEAVQDSYGDKVR